MGYSLTVRALSLNSYTNQLFFQFIDTVTHTHISFWSVAIFALNVWLQGPGFTDGKE